MLRLQRSLSLGPFLLVNDVLNLILIKLTQNDIQSARNNEFYKKARWIVRAQYSEDKSFMKDSYNEVADMLAVSTKQNIGPNVYNKLDKSLKTKITHLLANDFFDLFKSGSYLKNGGAEFDDKHHVETVLYYFDINDRNRDEFKQRFAAQWQNTFAKMTLLLSAQNNEVPLPPLPVMNHGPLPVVTVEKDAPASVRLKR